MKQRLPRKLGPKAKRAFLKEPSTETVLCTVEFAPTTDLAAFESALQTLGAVVRSRNERTRLLTVEIPVPALRPLAELDDVVYVEVAQAYRH